MIRNRLLQWARHKRFQAVWEKLHNLSLVGMNYWASDMAVTGELDALAYVAARTPAGQLVIDVGANVGDYSAAVLKAFPEFAALHAFEPSRGTAELYRERFHPAIESGKLSLHVQGLSDREHEAVLHTAGAGSATASLYDLSPVTLYSVPHDPAKSETVRLTTLDAFCEAEGVARIDLLKVDAEGHDPAILRGAARMLKERKIQFVQFEFGPFNVDSRTFLRDLFDMLDGYAIHRIVPVGLIELGSYHPRLERFATANYLAELR